MLISKNVEFAQHDSSTPRLEVKYVLTPCSRQSATAFLNNRFKRISFNNDVSHVYSVYLDTPGLTRVEHCLAGLPHRRKLRLRWYDCPLPETFFYLELKQRLGKYCQKERCRFELNDNIYSSQGDSGISINSIVGNSPEIFRPQISQGDIPTVLIDYKRLHFQTLHLPVRITLDYDLKATRIRSLESLKRLGKTISFGGPIIEVKAPPELEPELAQLLSPLRLRKSRYSKYLQGCRVHAKMLGRAATFIEKDGF